jgi:hypothetical protein
MITIMLLIGDIVCLLFVALLTIVLFSILAALANVIMEPIKNYLGLTKYVSSLGSIFLVFIMTILIYKIIG